MVLREAPVVEAELVVGLPDLCEEDERGGNFSGRVFDCGRVGGRVVYICQVDLLRELYISLFFCSISQQAIFIQREKNVVGQTARIHHPGSSISSVTIRDFWVSIELKFSVFENPLAPPFHIS